MLSGRAMRALRTVAIGLLVLVPRTAGAATGKAAVMRVAEATGTELKVTETQAFFDHTFRLEETGGVATNVSVEVRPFVSPDSLKEYAVCSLNAGPCGTSSALNGFGSMELRIQADMRLFGAYSGTVSVIADASRTTYSLLVTRVRAAAPFEVTVPDTIAGTGDGVLLRMIVHEIEGRAQVVTMPRVRSLARKTPEGAWVDSGKWFAEASDHGVRREPNFELARDETKDIEVRIRGLTDPGTYTASVTLGATRAEPVTKSVTLLVKAPWTFAVGFILLGVIVSSGIRWLTLVARPGLQRSLRLGRAQSRLQSFVGTLGELDRDERDLVARVDWTIRRAGRLAGLNFEPADDAIFEKTDARLQLLQSWIRVHRRILVLVDAVGAAERDEVTAARQTLEDEDASSKALADGVTSMQELEKSLAAIIDRLLTQPMADLLGEVEQEAASIPAMGLKLKTVADKIRKAQGLMAKNEPEARACFEEARADNAILHAQSLLDVMAKSMPRGFHKAEWDALKAAISKLVEGIERVSTAEAVRQNAAAYARYFCGGVSMLRRVVGEERVLLSGGKPPISESAKPGLQTLLSAAEAKLSDLEALLDAQNLKAAPSAFEHAQTAVFGAVDQIAAAGQIAAAAKPTEKLESLGLPTKAIVASAAAPPAGSDSGSMPPRPMDYVPPLPSGWTLMRDLLLLEGTVTLLAAVLAVVLGLQTLHVDSATWGGGWAYVGAFVWGAGLHQFSGALLGGPRKLLEAFAK
jgi:hypothetical protein